MQAVQYRNTNIRGVSCYPKPNQRQVPNGTTQAHDDALFPTRSDIENKPPIDLHLFIVLLTLKLEPIRILLDPRNFRPIKSRGVWVLGKDLLADRKGGEGVAGQWYGYQVCCSGFITRFVAVLVLVYVLDVVCHSSRGAVSVGDGRRRRRDTTNRFLIPSPETFLMTHWMPSPSC